MEYADWTADDLLEALELAGRHPAPDLIRACLSRREELTPGLLEMLRTGTDDDWAEGDPRWYRDVHAGLLLIELREAAALPIFYDIFSDEDRQDTLGEWFGQQFPKYGAAAVPWLSRLAEDTEACEWGRVQGPILLGKIAELMPEERTRVLSTVRGTLPELSPDGNFVLPEAGAEPDEEDVRRWTFAIGVLMDLQDEGSRDRVLAMYEDDLVDTEIVGDRDRYIKEIEGGGWSRSGPDPVDLVTFYEDLAARDNRWEGGFADEEFEELDELVSEFKAKTGMSDEQVADALLTMALKEELLERGVFDDDEEFVAHSVSPATHSPMPFHAETHPGRNDPCPCGSGKKYKKCHGRTA
ncbi:MAG TPA: DUF1186 domain-containing protein [Rhodothermales bacterium]|nr:DUF1186 domain-containing protein [Rhodothermales bacterium]